MSGEKEKATPIEGQDQLLELMSDWRDKQDEKQMEGFEKIFDKFQVDLTENFQKVFDDALKAADRIGTKPMPSTDEEDEGKSFGDFLLQVKEADRGNSKAAERLNKVYKAALAEQSGITGGYTVPDEFRNQLLEIVWEQSIVRDAGATVIPMSRRILEYPVLDVTSAPSAGQPAQFGGLVMTWEGEADALAESEPKFRNVKLEAQKLAAYSLASSELLADSAVALEGLLRRLAGGAIAWFEDYAFLRGTGTGQPLGIVTWMNNAGFSNVGATKTTASRFKIPDAGNMIELLMPGAYGRSVWLAHQSFISEFVRMSSQSEVTTSGGAVMTWQPDSKNGAIFPLKLYNRPVYITEKLPSINTDGSIILADMQQYIIGDRGDLAVDMSEHYKFVNDQVTFRFKKRVDGKPALNSYITLADASTVVSPFVTVNY